SCDFLASIAAPDGGLPAFLPGALDYPAAEHWRHGFGAKPSLERTCGGVSLLAWHGAKHPWLTDATTRCERYLADARIDEANHLRYAFQFASIVLNGSARDAMLERLRRMLNGAEYYIAEPPVERYGLTPLRFAPSPDAPARRFFDDATIARHLDDLEQAQQSDGGWTIRFAPPTPAAASEWRGYFTLEALRTLRAYGRL